MGPQPRAEEGPEAFHRIDVDLAKAIPILVSGILTRAMADAFVQIAPLSQSVVDGVLVGVHPAIGSNGCFDDGLNGGALHVLQQANNDLSAPLYHPKDRRFFGLECPSTPKSLEFTPTARTAFL